MTALPHTPARPASCALAVHVLGSGSAGNALAVRGPGGVVLLDCGLSARETVRRLDLVGIAAEEVRAVVVSHEHSDHLKGVRVLAKRLGLTVWASAGTRRAAAPDALGADVRTVRDGDRFEVAGLTVHAFRTSHDAAEPLGFRFDAPRGPSLGVLTDTGELTGEAREALADCELLGIESNHCPDLLAAGPYPAFLKRRIASATGHLSNSDAASALGLLATDRLRAVVALHLSATNNAAPLAAAALGRALERLSHPARVITASQVDVCAVGAPMAHDVQQRP